MTIHPEDERRLDAALVRAQHGDHEAFAVIVELLHWPLRCWLAPRCQPSIDPDEIAHVSLVEAFRCRDRYTAGTNVRAWVWSLARNKLLEEQRATRRHKRHAFLDQIAERLTAADDDDHDTETVEALRRCLRHLTPTAREVLSRHYDRAQPIAEIASAIGRSVAAVKKAMFTARRFLEECLRHAAQQGQR